MISETVNSQKGNTIVNLARSGIRRILLTEYEEKVGFPTRMERNMVGLPTSSLTQHAENVLSI